MKITLRKSFGGQGITIDNKTVPDKLIVSVRDKVLTEGIDYFIEDLDNKEIELFLEWMNQSVFFKKST